LAKAAGRKDGFCSAAKGFGFDVGREPMQSLLSLKNR